LISILSDAMSHPDLPPNAKFIISSRREEPIIGNMSLRKKEINLDTSLSKGDVDRFLTSRMNTIVPNSWGRWPEQPQLDMLCDHADGHFQWAATATRFIEDEINLLGTKCQGTVLKKVTIAGKGMEKLDKLYHFILERFFPKAYENEQRIWFRRIVGGLVVRAEALAIGEFQCFLNISPNDYDVLRFFQNLRSIFVPGTAQVGETTVPQMHKSFFDYITSGRVDETFRIDVYDHHRHATVCAFQVMNSDMLQFNICALKTSYLTNNTMISKHDADTMIAPCLSYACRFWGHHLQGLTCDSETLDKMKHVMERARQFLEEKFLYWLEVLSLLRCTHEACNSLSLLIMWAQV
jgi:hypothetical protein